VLNNYDINYTGRLGQKPLSSVGFESSIATAY